MSRAKFMEPAIPVLDSPRKIKPAELPKAELPKAELPKAELLPDSRWQHFRGKIFNIVTPARGHETKDQLIVYQDVKTFEVFVRLREDFVKPLQDGRARYKSFNGSLAEARLAYK